MFVLYLHILHNQLCSSITSMEHPQVTGPYSVPHLLRLRAFATMAFALLIGIIDVLCSCIRTLVSYSLLVYRSCICFGGWHSPLGGQIFYTWLGFWVLWWFPHFEGSLSTGSLLCFHWDLVVYCCLGLGLCCWHFFSTM